MKSPNEQNTFLFSLVNYRAALLAAIFFGSIAPFTKVLGNTIPPQSLAGILYFSAGIGLIAMLFFRGISKSIKNLKSSDKKWFLMAVLFGGILGPAFLTYGLMRISGASASLLLNFEGVCTSLLAWFVFKEHFEKRIVWGMSFIILGCLALSFQSTGGSGHDTISGFILIILACLSWGVDNNVTRNISHLDPILTASFKGLIAGAANLSIGFFIGERIGLHFGVLQAAVLGFLGIGVSLVCFILSLSRIGTARTGALFSTAPFVGAVVSVVVLREPITIPFAIALILMGFGVYLHLSEDHSHGHTHEELTHAHEHSHDEHHKHLHSAGDPEGEPHVHLHTHSKLTHSHPHFPDIHHQHKH